MIVGIVNQTVPVGIVKMAEFREAVDVTTAVNDFATAHDVNAADYLGIDTGWSEYVYPNSGYGWAWDFDNPALVQELLPDRLTGLSLTQVISDPKSDPSGGTTPFAWEDMGRVSVNLDLFMDLPARAQFRIWGQHMTHQEGANVPQIRLSAGGVAYSDVIDLPDTGGAWQNFDINTIGYALPTTRTLFVVQTLLRNALSTIDLRAVSIAIMQKNF